MKNRARVGFKVLGGSVALTWWAACFGLPSLWVAIPVTAAVSIAFVSRDSALVLGLYALVPRHRGQSSANFSAGARRVAGVRLVGSLGLAICAIFILPPLLAGIPLIYAISSAVLREHFPDLHGGPSYVRVLFGTLVRQAVGAKQAEVVRTSLRPAIWLATATAVFATALSSPALADMRSQVATIGIKTLVTSVQRAVDHPTTTTTTTTTSTTTVPSTSTKPPPPPPPAPAPESSDQQLVELCGTDTLDLPADAEVFRERLQTLWYHLGANVAGCQNGSALVVPSGGVVVYLHDGESNPAAFVATPNMKVAVFVQSSRLDLLNGYLQAGTFDEVFGLKTTFASDYQIFRLTQGCVLSVMSYGLGRVDLDQTASAAVIDVVATIGGTIERLSETSPSSEGAATIDLTINLNGETVTVTLEESGGVQVVSGPVSVMGASAPENTSCSTAAISEVLSQS
jgi:hypothetical protein